MTAVHNRHPTPHNTSTLSLLSPPFPSPSPTRTQILSAGDIPARLKAEVDTFDDCIRSVTTLAPEDPGTVVAAWLARATRAIPPPLPLAGTVHDGDLPLDVKHFVVTAFPAAERPLTLEDILSGVLGWCLHEVGTRRSHPPRDARTTLVFAPLRFAPLRFAPLRCFCTALLAQARRTGMLTRFPASLCQALHDEVLAVGYDEHRILFLIVCESWPQCGRGSNRALHMWFKLSDYRMRFQGADLRTDPSLAPLKHHAFMVHEKKKRWADEGILGGLMRSNSSCH